MAPPGARRRGSLAPLPLLAQPRGASKSRPRGLRRGLYRSNAIRICPGAAAAVGPRLAGSRRASGYGIGLYIWSVDAAHTQCQSLAFGEPKSINFARPKSVRWFLTSALPGTIRAG